MQPSPLSPEVVYVVNQDDGNVALKIEEKPSGPLILIEQSGRVTVTRAPPDEAGRLFWDAVNISGMTYRQRIQALEEANKILELQVMALSKDPFKSVIHGSAEVVWQNIPKAVRGRMVRADVRQVLETVNKLACKEIQ